MGERKEGIGTGDGECQMGHRDGGWEIGEG